MLHKGNIICLFFFFFLSCHFQQVHINVIFDDLNGLTKEDRVLFDGNTIGSVTSFEYNQDGNYTAEISIDKGFTHAVTEFSRFVIITDPGNPESKALEIRLDQKGGDPLANGATVRGESQEQNFGAQLQDKLKSGFSFFKKQIEKFGEDLQQYPNSDEYQKLKKTLEDLAAEIEQKEKQTREKIKREWLPQIQREMDELREKLKQFGREGDMAPLDDEMERIIRI